MQKAIDKHVILMMGLLFLLNRSLTYGPAVTFLAALISMELIIYLEKEAAFYGIVAVYVLACFFAPGLDLLFAEMHTCLNLFIEKSGGAVFPVHFLYTEFPCFMGLGRFFCGS